MENLVVKYKNMLIAISDTADTESHKHYMQQIFITDNIGILFVNGQAIDSTVTVVEAGVMHQLNISRDIVITLFVEPTSGLAKHLRERLINQDKGFGDLGVVDICSIRKKYKNNQITSKDLIEVIEQLFKKIEYDYSYEMEIEDERLMAIQKVLSVSDLEEVSVKKLAKEFGISESRLSHYFKEKYKITLQGYILYYKWMRAISKIIATGNITEGAYLAGFSSSSHFSNANRKMTGLSGKEFSKNSRFL